MTKDYAAQRLLEHGALCRSEFLEITGWHKATATRVLDRLLSKGVVRRTWRGVYALAGKSA